MKRAILPVAVTVVCALGLSGTAQASTDAPVRTGLTVSQLATSSTTSTRVAPEAIAELTEALQRIEAMPQSVLDQGDAAARSYLLENGGAAQKLRLQALAQSSTKSATLTDSDVVQGWNRFMCITSVTAAVINLTFSVTEFAAIQQLIKAFGTVAKLVEKIIIVFEMQGPMEWKVQKVFGLLGKAALDVIMAFIGTPDVVAYCSKWDGRRAA